MSKKAKREHKTVFTPEIDKRISGFALAFTLIAVGFILQFYPTYFGNLVLTKIIKWIFVVFGILGFTVEFIKQKSSIKGLDNFFIGLFFFGVWLGLFIFVKNWIVNTVTFFCLIFGLYGLMTGIQQIIHSTSVYRREKKESGASSKQNKDDILLFLTKLLGVILVAAQICKAIIDINLPQG